MTESEQRFAYRERAHTPGEPVRPVELVKGGPPRSQKVKVRWLDGEYEGLEEWVPKIRLVAPWEEKEALLEDERRMFAALEISGDVYVTAAYQVGETVFFTVPQEAGAEVWFGAKEIKRELLSIDDLDAAAERLGLHAEALLSEPCSYTGIASANTRPVQGSREGREALLRKPPSRDSATPPCGGGETEVGARLRRA